MQEALRRGYIESNLNDSARNQQLKVMTEATVDAQGFRTVHTKPVPHIVLPALWKR